MTKKQLIKELILEGCEPRYSGKEGIVWVTKKPNKRYQTNLIIKIHKE